MSDEPLPPPGATLGIAEVAELTGLSKDTLRWYERRGLIRAVDRTTGGRRRYDAEQVRLVLLLVRLRRTGMSVADMETFMDLLAQGTATHGRRRALLDRHRTEVLARMEQVRADLEAIDAKIAHYDRLIAAGLDCGGTP